MNVDYLAGVGTGLFVAGLIWLCFDIRAKNRQLERDLRDLEVDDEFDPDQEHRVWVKVNVGGGSFDIDAPIPAGGAE